MHERRSFLARRLRLISVASAVALFGSLLWHLPPATGYTNFFVNTTADTPTDAGCTTANCTLREAIEAANASPGNDAITISGHPSVPGTITLTSPLPAVTDQVTIYSQGSCLSTAPSIPTTTIDASGLTTGVGLRIEAPTLLWGVSITGAPGHGLAVSSTQDVTILCGRFADNRGSGIRIDASSNVKLGQGGDPVTTGANGAPGVSAVATSGLLLEAGTFGVPVDDGPALRVDETLGAVSNPMGQLMVRFGSATPRVVEIVGDTSRMQVTKASYAAAGGQPVDLGADGVDVNDAGDPDVGPNLRLNTPTVQEIAAGDTTVTVGLDVPVGSSYRLDLFDVAGCDSVGRASGLDWVAGNNAVRVDTAGPATATVTLPSALAEGDAVAVVLTKDWTNPTGHSSELSSCRSVGTVQEPPSFGQLLYHRSTLDSSESGLAVLTPPATDGAPIADVPGVSGSDWSPAGDRVAFTRSDGLWVADVDGTHAMRLLSGASMFRTAWAPDGRTVYFDQLVSGNREIKALDLATDAVTTVLGRPGDDTVMDLSSDGATMLIRSNASGQRELELLDLGTGTVDGLDTGPGEAGFGAFSADDTRVVTTPLSTQVLSTVPVPDGGTPVPVRTGLTADNFDWAPDSDWVAYTSGGRVNAVLVGGTAAPVALTDSTHRAHSPRWRPVAPPAGTPPTAVDDSYLYVVGTGEQVLPAPGVLGNDSGPQTLTGLVVDDETGLAGGQVTVSATGALHVDTTTAGTWTFTYRAVDALGRRSAPATVTVRVDQPALDPLEQEIMFRYNDSSIATVPPKASPTVLVPNNNMAQFDWSPDGSRFAYRSVDGIWIADADGSNAQRVYDQPVFYLTWSSDGKTLYAGGAGSGSYDLIAIDIATGATSTKVGTSANEEPTDVSPDSTKVLFQKPTAAGSRLFQLDVASGATSQVNTGPGDATEGRYSPDGTRIVYLQRLTASSQYSVAIVPVEGGTPTIMTRNVSVFAVDWSPDGQWIAYGDQNSTPIRIRALSLGAPNAPVDITATTYSATGDLRWRPGDAPPGGIAPPPGTAPTSVDDSYTFPSGSGIQAIPAPGVLGNDIDGTSTVGSAQLVSATGVPVDALQFFGDGGLTWDTAASGVGTWTFSYRALDAAGRTSGHATVTVSVNPPPVGPVQAADDHVTLEAGSTVTLDSPGVLGNDTGLGLVARALTTLNGRVSVAADGRVTVDAVQWPPGTYSTTYRATDTDGAYDDATIIIDVTPKPGDPPSGEDDIVVAMAGEVSTDPAPGVLSNDSGFGPLMSVRTLGGTMPDTAWILVSSGKIEVDARDLEPGVYTGYYYTVDAAYRMDPQRHRIAFHVLPPGGEVPLPGNGAPAARPDRYTVAPGEVVSISRSRGVLANDRDERFVSLVAVFGSPGSLPITALPVFGSDGSLRIDATGLAEGTYTFTYSAVDSAGLSSGSVPVEVVVDNFNECPTPRDDTYQVTEGTYFRLRAPGVLGNDLDLEGNIARASLVGTFTRKDIGMGTDGSIFLDARAANAGTFREFRYRSVDSYGEWCGEGVVHLDIVPNIAPVAHANAYSVGAGQSFALPARGVLANDFDEDGPEDGLTAQIGTLKLSGLTLNADGSFSFKVPKTAGIGTVYTFNYRARDIAGKYSNYAQVRLEVVRNPPPAPKPPVANGESHTVHAGDTMVLLGGKSLLANDSDPDAGGRGYFVEQVAGSGEEFVVPRNGEVVLRTSVADTGKTFRLSYYVIDFDGLRSRTVSLTVNVIPPRERCTTVDVALAGDAVTTEDRLEIANASAAFMYCWDYRTVTRAGFVGPDGQMVTAYTSGVHEGGVGVDYSPGAIGSELSGALGFITFDAGGGNSYSSFTVLDGNDGVRFFLHPNWHSCVSPVDLVLMLAKPISGVLKGARKLPFVGGRVGAMIEGGAEWVFTHSDTAYELVHTALTYVLDDLLEPMGVFGDIAAPTLSMITEIADSMVVPVDVNGETKSVSFPVALALAALGSEPVADATCVPLGDYRDATVTHTIRASKNGSVLDTREPSAYDGNLVPVAELATLTGDVQVQWNSEVATNEQIVGPDRSTWR